MYNKILGVGSIVKMDGKFTKVVEMGEDRNWNEYVVLEYKGKFGKVDKKAVKWDGKKFVVKFDA